MSIDAISYAKTLDVPTPTGRLLLYVIAENTFNDSGISRVGQSILAEETGTSVRTVRRTIEKLEAAKLVMVHATHDATGRKPDRIELLGFLDWLAMNRGKRRGSIPEVIPEVIPESPPAKLSAGVEDSPPAKLTDPTGQQVAGTYKDNRTSEPYKNPPTPQGGKLVGNKSQGKGKGEAPKQPAKPSGYIGPDGKPPIYSCDRNQPKRKVRDMQLTEALRKEASEHCRGRDVRALFTKWKSWQSDQDVEAVNPEASFIAYCRKFGPLKGKVPKAPANYKPPADLMPKAGEVTITKAGAEWPAWQDYADKIDRAAANRLRGAFVAFVPHKYPVKGDPMPRVPGK